MSNKLKGKNALITGGTTGIGFATAKRFISEGAAVTVTGTNPKTLDAARAELGDDVDVLQSDASSEQDIKKLFEDVVAKRGKLDVLFLNAGIARFAPWQEHSVEDFDRQFAINVRGPWLALKYGADALNDGASVIATTSVVNRLAMPGSSAYSATKAALHQLVKVAAQELSPRGIRVNSVSPGPIETPIFDKTGVPPEQQEQMAAQLQSQVALGRFGKSEEVANLALFLASNESSYIQAQEFAVDGGMTF